MEIHPTDRTQIVDIVMHHFMPHVAGPSQCRLVGGTPRIGVTSLRPDRARMLDKVLGDAVSDLKRRGASELKLGYSLCDQGFVLEVQDNGRTVQELPSMREAVRTVGSDLEVWVTDGGWNMVKLTCGF